MSDLIERLQRYADGVLGKSELKVGPHMCADAFCEARDALSSLKAEVERLSGDLGRTERAAQSLQRAAHAWEARAEAAERDATNLREALPDVLALRERATPGPWAVDQGTVIVSEAMPPVSYDGHDWRDWETERTDRVGPIFARMIGETRTDDGHADAAFIVALVNWFDAHASGIAARSAKTEGLGPEGESAGDAEGGNRPNPLILPPLLGESKMIQSDNLIERLRANLGNLDGLAEHFADVEACHTDETSPGAAAKAIRAAIEHIESAEREAEKLRDVCADLLSLVKGDLSGPSQMAGVIREAEAAIESPPGRPTSVGQALGEQR